MENIKKVPATDSLEILFLAEPARIAFVTKIFESMSHLAILSTLDRQRGLLRAVCTPEAVKEVRRLLQELGCILG